MQRILNPRLSRHTAFYDAASNICQALSEEAFKAGKELRKTMDDTRQHLILVPSSLSQHNLRSLEDQTGVP